MVIIYHGAQRCRDSRPARATTSKGASDGHRSRNHTQQQLDVALIDTDNVRDADHEDADRSVENITRPVN
jgi:hypothetical protein